MSARSERTWTVRKLVGGAEDDGSFDLEFWEQAGAEARFAAASEMAVTARMMEGLDGPPPRHGQRAPP